MQSALMVLFGVLWGAMGSFAQDSRPAIIDSASSQPEKNPTTTSAPAAKELPVDPLYRHWAQFRPGSFAKLRTTTDAGGRKSVSLITFTLKEVTPEKVLVEILSVDTADDRETRMPAQLVEHLARFEAPETDRGSPAEYREGNETIKSAGKKWNTHWTLTAIQQVEFKRTTKNWTSDDVPGMTVKTHSELSGVNRVTIDTVLVDARAERR